MKFKELPNESHFVVISPTRATPLRKKDRDGKLERGSFAVDRQDQIDRDTEVQQVLIT